MVEPGDGFEVSCVYNHDVSASGEEVKFGLGSNDEMCIAFLMFYPKLTDMNECGINSQTNLGGGERKLDLEKTLDLAAEPALYNTDLGAAFAKNNAADFPARRHLPSTCVDNDSTISALSQGIVPSCGAAEAFCVDDSILVPPFPQGYFESLCCDTCEQIPDNADFCDYEDSMAQLFFGISSCAEFSHYCANDDDLTRNIDYLDPGSFGVACCKTCDGIEYVPNAAEVGCSGEYEWTTNLTAVDFREFGASCGGVGGVEGGGEEEEDSLSSASAGRVPSVAVATSLFILVVVAALGVTAV